jgi:hypothetical protein
MSVGQDFYIKLREHLLQRVFPRTNASTLSSGSNLDAPPQSTVVLQHDRIYSHALMRINYTTDDVQRTQDVISHKANRDNVMVLANRTNHEQWTHPFAYARVLGIFHVNVFFIGRESTDFRPRRIEFLWVRWYRVLEPKMDALQYRRLDQVDFPPLTDPKAFGFLDPADVVRSCYIVPAFFHGQRHGPEYEELSNCAKDRSDWKRYYVQRYVYHHCVAFRAHIALW